MLTTNLLLAAIFLVLLVGRERVISVAKRALVPAAVGLILLIAVGAMLWMTRTPPSADSHPIASRATCLQQHSAEPWLCDPIAPRSELPEAKGNTVESLLGPPPPTDAPSH